jgi:hypothetical protein
MIKLKIKEKIYLFVIDILEPSNIKTLRNNDDLDVTILKSNTEIDYRVTDEIYKYTAFDLRAANEDVR